MTLKISFHFDYITVFLFIYLFFYNFKLLYEYFFIDKN